MKNKDDGQHTVENMVAKVTRNVLTQNQFIHLPMDDDR